MQLHISGVTNTGDVNDEPDTLYGVVGAGQGGETPCGRLRGEITKKINRDINEVISIEISTEIDSNL